MKKEWVSPKVQNLSAKDTMYGGDTSKDHDGPYVEVGGEKYWPHGSK